jgi:hypothetical protein
VAVAYIHTYTVSDCVYHVLVCVCTLFAHTHTRVCNDTFEWQSMPCQESANRECEMIDFSTPCAPGRYRGNHTKNKDSECLMCQYQDTTYQGSHLHESVTP